MLAADALDLGHNVAHVHAGAQSQRHQTANGLCLGRDGAARLADGGKNLKGLAVHFVDGEIHRAKPGGHLLRKAPHNVGPLAHTSPCLSSRRACLRSIRAAFAVHFLLPFARGQHLNALAAVTVDRHALAAFLIGQPVNIKNILFRCAVGQVHGF